MPATFIDYDGELEDPDLPVRPPSDKPKPPGQLDDTDYAEERYGHLLPYGTTPSPEWTPKWVKLVIKAEAEKRYAICGAKRKSQDIDIIDMEDADPLVLVCKSRAGYGTDHPGEGRCVKHGGNSHLGTLKTGRFSLIKNNRLSGRVNEFFEAEELLDLRSVIGVTWAAVDAMLEEDEEITPQRAAEVGAMMTRVANMIKQHNDIQEKKRIAIDVPEFMAWAEHFYELSVKYIAASGGDVASFLKEAQQFYDRTVTIVVGPEARRNSLGTGREVSAVSHESVPRPALEDS